LLVFVCNFEDALLILLSLNKHKHERSFETFVSKFEGWKGRHFYGRPRAAHSLTTPLLTTEKIESKALLPQQNWRHYMQIGLQSKLQMQNLEIDFLSKHLHTPSI